MVLLSPQSIIVQINPQNLREDIHKVIPNPKLWNFNYVPLSKNEILQFSELEPHHRLCKDFIGEFYRGSTDIFDEQCRKACERFILENNSILGIDLGKIISIFKFFKGTKA